MTGRAEERLSFDVQREHGRSARLYRPSGPEGRRALHEALLPRRQGRRRPDPHLLRRARGAPRQAGARRSTASSASASASAAPSRARPISSSTTSASTSPAAMSSRATRSTSSASSTSPTAPTSPSIPKRCRQVTRSLHLIDAALRENPEANRLFVEILSSRKHAEVVLRRDERDRRARPLHPRFRPHRRDDAVQHVSPLHGRRAPDPLDRRPRRDRARRGGRGPSARQRDLPRHQGPHRPLCRALPARHRQGPAGGPLDRRRPRRAQARAALRARPRRRPRPSPGWSSIIS